MENESKIEIPENHSLVKDDDLGSLIALVRDMAAGARLTEERWKATFELTIKFQESMCAGLTAAAKTLGDEVIKRAAEYAVLQERFNALAQVADEWVPEDEHQEVVRAVLKHVRAGGRVSLSK